jgi:uncharacterized protein YndB with AHSA1/START domain
VATEQKTLNITLPSDREIALTRIYDAPRDMVWRAWTEPERVVQWWGPLGFTTTIQEMDVRPGGTWRFIMHGPDGTDYENKVDFIEIVEPERLVYDHGGGDESDEPQFRVTVTFDEENGGTRITMRSVFASAEERDRVVEEFGAIEGGKQTLERLNEYLARNS